MTGFSFTYNAAPHNAYGVNGASASPGALTLQMFFPSATVTGNWLSGANLSIPVGEPRRIAIRELRCGPRERGLSPHGALAANATDGRPAGADIDALVTMQGIAIGKSGAPMIKAPADVRIISSGG